MSKFYVCTAIPYVNAKAHIGHAMDFLYADILARYHRAQGDDVKFSIGTDEHGAKIAEKAVENKVTPQEYTDKIVPLWKDFAERLDLSNDYFIRTTDHEHEERAGLIWENLSQYIYKGSYAGWYCVGCEEYKTEQHVKDTNGTCPEHNRPYDKLEEENYFFKLSSFSDQVKKATESDSLRIIPEFRKREIINVINEGLQDISISRPADKISWGIPVPHDPKQVMYVWFEALMNYITVLGYPDSADFTTYWPADVQVIGKDILRFHAAIWPAMLLALGLPLPKVLYSHGHVGSGGQKMSKTLGNVIDPLEAIEKHGVDAFRYFFARHISSYDDGDFTWEKFEEAYNNELANELGNAVSRVAAMIVKYQEGVIGDIPPAEHDTNRYHEALSECRFDRALEEIWEQVRGLNQYIDEEKPWEVAKEGDSEQLQEVLAYMASALLEIAELLVPFMPQTAEKIKGVFAEGIIRQLDGPLFPKEQ
ncbi:methionine--tRNA ligase [Candidatus Saccharibacteria bacterium]|nr:methionine--tRNA ligase [Candidatus Saccharibacteria bacterium]